MKKVVALGLAMVMVLCCGCAKEEQFFYEGNVNVPQNLQETSEEVLKITVPESYFVYTGSDPESEAIACVEMGLDYCTDAWAEESTMIIELTEIQRDNFIKRNDEYGEELRTSFLELDENYKFEGSEDYTNITFYCDEKVAIMSLVEAMYGTTSQYALNYILRNNSNDWCVHIKIVNYHTNKVVAEGDLPNDEITIGANEWAASYLE